MALKNITNHNSFSHIVNSQIGSVIMYVFYKCMLTGYFCSPMQFAHTEGYQPASLRLIKEALKMEPPNKKLHAGSRTQSEGNESRSL